MNHQDYEGTMETRLRELGQKIDALSREAQNTALDAKETYREGIDALRSQRDEIARNLQRLKQSSGRAWEDIQGGMDTVWDNVQAVLRKAFSDSN